MISKAFSNSKEFLCLEVILLFPSTLCENRFQREMISSIDCFCMSVSWEKSYYWNTSNYLLSWLSDIRDTKHIWVEWDGWWGLIFFILILMLKFNKLIQLIEWYTNIL